MWKDAKYLIAYLSPLSAFFAISVGGIWSFSTVFLAFILIPILELFIPPFSENLSADEEMAKVNAAYFDWMLYLNFPLLYGLLFSYYVTLQSGGLATYEVVGMTLCVGIIIGSTGINVAHELGHRRSWIDQLISKLLLIPALYMHFNIEHNRGHHKRVGTDADPASARFGENIYAFWLRSVWGSYWSAWGLEASRLQRIGERRVSLKNEMIRFQFIQFIYLVLVALVFNLQIAALGVAAAIIGFLLLETVNYIEHYGLRRRKLADGRYEKVQPHHSWNSNHLIGRILLYELTRHSDHHYKASRKYQVLRHFNHTPQLPMGYPASIISTLIPILWFRVMNDRVKAQSAFIN